MGQVLIRNLDDRVIESIKHRAESKGHSLEQELREIIKAAAPFTPEERIAFSKDMLARSGGPFEPLTKEQIREGLE